MHHILASLICFILSISHGLAEENVLVSTSQGLISGYSEETVKGKSFYSFHSIPYAKPPVGKLRFKDPVPHEKWTDVKDGSVIHSACPQIPWLDLTKREPSFQGSEDCLYLSVYTDKPNDVNAKKPVLLFIHGGGFITGESALYPPYVLLDEDLVYVAIQYRLGVLGFLSTDDDIIPGNFGLKDQVMALQWVQDNIEYFGGDKNRVTIFGESAGGASVHFHVLSPRSAGLFTRAILQSGTLFAPWAMGGAYREVAEYTGKLFDCPSPRFLSGQEYSKSLLGCLLKVNTTDLTMSLSHHILWNYNPALIAPKVDGDFIPDDPEILMREEKYNEVDIITGVTTHEGALFASPLFGVKGLKNELLNNFEEIGPASLDIEQGDSSPLELAQKVFDHYVGGIRADLEDADNLCKMYGDWHFVHGHDTLAKLYTRSSSPKAFLYELNHRGQHFLGDWYTNEVGKNWVSHCDDIYYLFGYKNLFWAGLELEQDFKLRYIMTKMWFNFAATGNPTPDDSLGFIWDAADTKLNHLSLNPSPSMIPDHRMEERKFLESLPTRLNKLLHPDIVTPLTQLGDEQKGQRKPEGDRPRKYSIKDEL